MNGAKYTKDFHFKNFLYSEKFDDRLLAVKREKQIKGWSKAKKEALMTGKKTKLKNLSIPKQSPRYKSTKNTKKVK